MPLVGERIVTTSTSSLSSHSIVTTWGILLCKQCPSLSRHWSLRNMFCSNLKTHSNQEGVCNLVYADTPLRGYAFKARISVWVCIRTINTQRGCTLNLFTTEDSLEIRFLSLHTEWGSPLMVRVQSGIFILHCAWLTPPSRHRDAVRDLAFRTCNLVLCALNFTH